MFVCVICYLSYRVSAERNIKSIDNEGEQVEGCETTTVVLILLEIKGKGKKNINNNHKKNAKG